MRVKKEKEKEKTKTKKARLSSNQSLDRTSHTELMKDEKDSAGTIVAINF